MNPFWSITIFWVLAAGAVAVALAFVLPWLLRQRGVERSLAARRDINLAVYRDQMNDLSAEYANGQLTEAQYLASKLELETRAAEDALAQEELASAPASSRRLGYGLAVALPLATISLYAWLGNPNALMAGASGSNAVTMASQPTEADIQAIIQRIEERAKASPNDIEVWETLANAQAMLNRWPEALKAYEKSFELAPNKASVLSGYAEALAMTGDLLMAGRPMEMVSMALQIDPNDRKGLELSAIHAFQNQDYAESAQFLDRLLRLVSPEMPYAQEILRMRNEALRLAERGDSAQAMAAPSPSNVAPRPTDTNVASVAGSVEVSPALQSRVRAESTIYLIARSAEGGPPLAASRVAMGVFPMSFRLDDHMAMNPSNTLSDHQKVELVARISASGSPMAQSGDLEGRVVGVAVGAKNVKVVIDRVVP